MSDYYKEGKKLTEEELEEVLGGITISKGSGFWDRMNFYRCDCGSYDFEIVSISRDRNYLTIRCKNCSKGYTVKN